MVEVLLLPRPKTNSNFKINPNVIEILENEKLLELNSIETYRKFEKSVIEHRES